MEPVILQHNKPVYLAVRNDLDRMPPVKNSFLPAGSTRLSLPIFRRASLAIDDFGATAELAATVEVEDWNKPYPASEFDITKLNTEGWSGATNTGSFVTGLTFEGRSSVVSIGKAETNLNGNALIMNNYSSPPSADLSETPYMLVDYYYRHDASSTKNAASQMR